jgi:hypothetical protein
MKHYTVSIDDIKLLAYTTAQLDHVKGLLPESCAAVRESVVLVNRAHNTLERILGDDAALVYAPCDEEDA